MAEYRAFVARLNTDKEGDLIAHLEALPSFVQWVRDHALADMQQVGAGTIAPTHPAGDAPDLAQFAHIVRATVSSVLDEKLRGALATAPTPAETPADLESELGDRLDGMEF